jgi:hypothetical protein
VPGFLQSKFRSGNERINRYRNCARASTSSLHAERLEGFLKKIRNSVNEVPDVSTAKGRARIASLAAQVSRSKTAIEKPGRDYLKRLKELPKKLRQSCAALSLNVTLSAMKFAAHSLNGSRQKNPAKMHSSSA